MHEYFLNKSLKKFDRKVDESSSVLVLVTSVGIAHFESQYICHTILLLGSAGSLLL